MNMMEEIDRFQVPAVNDNPEMQPLVSNITVYSDTSAINLIA